MSIHLSLQKFRLVDRLQVAEKNIGDYVEKSQESDKLH